MAEAKTMAVPFPLAGISRRALLDRSTAKDAPTSPWTVNCRPSDIFENRLRGGSRSGLSEYGGVTPQWPTGEVLTEAGDEITNEAGETILVEIGGAEALYPDYQAAMDAYGYSNVPEDLVASVGTVPTATLGCIWRDRYILAGGNLVYMSRQGDYTDWNYGADVEDTGRAFLLQASEAGEIGATITALVPHRDAFLLVATATTLWVLDGDPAGTGTLRNVSRDVGMVSGTAWTKVGDSIVFLSAQGLYQVGANGSGLADISGDRLPSELIGIDALNYTIHMGYRIGENGVYLFVVGDTYHWFFDLERKGYWPFRLTLDISAVFQYDGEMVVWDGTDYWTFEGEDDNGTDISSHVLFGPFQAGSPVEYSMLQSLHGTVQLEEDGEMTWRTIVGTTAEQVCQDAQDAIDNYVDGDTTEALLDVVSSGMWVDGRQVMAYPRTRGLWIVLWLNSNDAWAFENLFATMRTLGRWRG
jgi:hypothetical protein